MKSKCPVSAAQNVMHTGTQGWDNQDMFKSRAHLDDSESGFEHRHYVY